MVTIELKPNGLDPGTWGEAKQDLSESPYPNNAIYSSGYGDGWDDALTWVCKQLGIEEYQLPQGK